MAIAKTYVEIVKFAVKDIFDPKYKSAVAAPMQQAADKAVKGSSKLTLDVPKEKGAKGWSVNGSLVSLEPDSAGKKLTAKVSMAIAAWPGKSIKAMPSGSVSFVMAKADIKEKDVKDIAALAVEKAMESAVPYMEKTSPG